MDLIAGVDEAGRGPLAGPVFAAAVILDVKQPISGLTDSKKLSAKQREKLYQCIIEQSMSYGIAQVSAADIDQMNIHRASLLAMQRAIEQLTFKPTKVLVDGKFPPQVTMETECRIKGDLTTPVISAASILAKVARDRLMMTYHQQYPDYDFASNKGYPTAQHIKALAKHGICPLHRRSFAPVKQLVNDI